MILERIFSLRGFAAALTAAVLLVFCAQAEAAKPRKPQPNHKYAAIVIEADTGYVLLEENADKRLHPASLTKMMTLYLTFEALQKGRLSKNQRIYVSEHAASQPPSKLGLKPGSTIRVEDAILALVTKSANDVAVVLAEALGGSEYSFARMMTAKARQMGMSSTTFVNASGLHDPAQVSTARDMARLSQALIKHFPRDYDYFSTRTFYYNGVAYANHNHLMKTYQGMDGIKTGYVEASGFNLAASAVRNGTRLVGVVFGGRSTASRNAHMAKILDQSFARVTDIRVAGLSPKPPVPARKPYPGAAVASATSVSAARAALPEFDALGLVMGEGDADRNETRAQIPYRVVDAQAFAQRRDWSVQIGAFASEDAGVKALENARDRLPASLAARAESLLVPLATNRGTIYRARIAGLNSETAAAACRVIRGSCLVLSAQ